MAKAKLVDATWSDMKGEIAKLDTRQLVSLLADLYRFSSSNGGKYNLTYSLCPFLSLSEIIKVAFEPTSDSADENRRGVVNERVIR